MSFKTKTTAALAAALVFTFAGIDSSGAWAQNDGSAPRTAPSEAPLTAEVVPVFVENPVVQPLPQPAAQETSSPAVAETPAATAASLAELVARSDRDAPLTEELRCLAGAVYFEARGEPLEGQLAVAQVVVNRADSGRFPKTYCAVVTQRGQFSFVSGGRIPQAPTASKAWRRAAAIARIAHEGSWDSAAKDSLFFHATHVSPGWRAKRVATISSHVFYR